VAKTKDVRAAVEKELGFDPRVDSAHITVSNISGDVTLTGTVPSYRSTWRRRPPRGGSPG
jgi:osmotically-inducible protein OsmY